MPPGGSVKEPNAMSAVGITASLELSACDGESKTGYGVSPNSIAAPGCDGPLTG